MIKEEENPRDAQWWQLNIRDTKNTHIHIATREIQNTHPWQMMPHCLNTVRQILIHPAVFGAFAYTGHFHLLHILVIASEVLPLESHVFEDSLSTLSNRQITPHWKIISPSSKSEFCLPLFHSLRHILPYDYLHINLNLFRINSLYALDMPLQTGISQDSYHSENCLFSTRLCIFKNILCKNSITS